MALNWPLAEDFGSAALSDERPSRSAAASARPCGGPVARRGVAEPRLIEWFGFCRRRYAPVVSITIHAAVLEASGREPRTETLTLDEPRTGEVRVRMLASGVCHSDLHVRDGDWERPGPVVMGHEGAGIIETVGPGVDPVVTGLEPGRLVALAWTVPCGK